MKLTVLANHHGGAGMHYVGTQREVPEEMGKDLIAKGHAKEYEKGDEDKYPAQKSEQDHIDEQIKAGGKSKMDGFVADVNVSGKKEKKEKNANGTDK